VGILSIGFIEIQPALFHHPVTKSVKLPSGQLEGNRFAVFPAIDRGKAYTQFMGQFFLADTQLPADFSDGLRKIFRCLCHIGLPHFLSATSLPAAASERNLSIK
jgi:hypothetical protein